MKKIKNIFNKAVIMAVLGCSMLLSSCNDWLTIYPTNAVIHENYWQTKDDVNGMLATSYLQLLNNNAVERYIVWGELRADNIGTLTNTSNTYKYIVEANILENNALCNWSIFYKAINYANMVIEFAPEVVERDPDFTQGDLDIVMGEMYALRALCHFYLVRTFRDIPLARHAVVDDADVGDYIQVSAPEALDSIMKDLDIAENLVMNSGGFSQSYHTHNYGRITKNAVLAMKADVNLWRAAFATYYQGSDSIKVGNPDDYYRMCIENCDAVIESMNKQAEEANEKLGASAIPMGPGTDNPYYLIMNNDGGVNLSTTKQSKAYDEIFGGKNSSESIFELQFDTKTNVNSTILTFFGNDQGKGQFCVPRNFLSESKSVYKEEDLRLYSFTTTTELGGSGSASGGSGNEVQETSIAKYAAKKSPANTFTAEYYRRNGECDANWIFYRKTDVMLMKAEALTNLSTSTQTEWAEAFNLVKIIYDRSQFAEAYYLKDECANRDDYAQLVLDERARELSYEGKRWYDLVRVALRNGSTEEIQFVADKLDTNSGAVKSKMASINSLFFPIHEDELNVNPNLKQNPAYEISENIEQN